MKYRANIDGLRAIAVLSVIFYHASFHVFSGGFVGVDIFFVISGYLIGAMIIADTEANQFSFTRFYARRAGRILPALFFVMLCTLPFAYFLLVPNQLKDFSKSLIYVSTFVSNMYFMKHLNYFDTAVDLKPLIHTWSLSIEEQYYLIFPALMVAIAKLKRHWKIVLIASLGVMSYLILESGFINQSRAFYLFQTRYWELLIGVMVAFCHTYEHGRINESLKNYASYIGLGLIVFSIFLLSQKYPYPSNYTLIPTIGTALILFSVSQKNFVNDLLSARLFVGIGLISYSAYLWHQPLFAFSRIVLLKEPSVGLYLLLIGLTFLLALITWKYIEKPFRELSHHNKKLTLQISFAICLIFVMLGTLGEKNNGYPQRYSLPQSVLDQLHHKKYIACDGICQIGDVSKQTYEVALFGDSHAASLAYLFDELGKKQRVGVVYSGQLSCPSLLGAYAEESPDAASRCIRRNDENYNYVKDHPNIKKVFLVSRWTYYTDGGYQSENIKQLKLIASEHFQDDPHKSFEVALNATIDAYNKLGVKIYLVSQAPLQKVDSEELYYQLFSKYIGEQESINFIKKWSVKFNDHKELQSFVNDVFLKHAKNNEILFVIMDGVLCNAGDFLIDSPDQPIMWTIII